MKLVPTLNSLSGRLLIVLGAWTTIALLVMGLAITAYFKSNAERGFENLLQAHAYNLIGAIETDGGQMTASPDFGEPRFSTPLSGWYWAVLDAQDPSKIILNSASIEAEALNIPSADSVPFDETFKRKYSDQRDGITSLRVETQLFLGETTSNLFQVLVAGNRDELDAEIGRITRSVWLFLLAFGIGTLVIGYFAVAVGLKPLTKVQNELGDIREGVSNRLSSDYPEEIQPLAFEINALVDANKAVVERSRTQVGNLAHALKTPLAVIRNERDQPNKRSWDLVAEQTDLMDGQVRNYLDRARISAQRGSTLARTDFEPVVSRILRVMRKLNSSLEFKFDPNPKPIVFRIETHDLEEILGNLVENASRFARNRVVVSVEKLESSGSTDRFATIKIEDDGPGLSAVERERAVLRGERIDESMSGSGLGLSIVKDIATEYGGTFALDRSEAYGGLRACVSLPIVAIKTHNLKN